MSAIILISAHYLAEIAGTLGLRLMHAREKVCVKKQMTFISMSNFENFPFIPHIQKSVS